jgi:hypothetical protein
MKRDITQQTFVLAKKVYNMLSLLMPISRVVFVHAAPDLTLHVAHDR